MAARWTVEIKEVDRFLGEPKKLHGSFPEWKNSGFYGPNGRELTAIWPIQDSLGIVAKGQLRFALRPTRMHCPSVSLLYNSRAICRVDIEDQAVCKSNPPWAQGLGLQPTVCGSHIHKWQHNRAHILAQDKWELPCREKIPAQVRKLDQIIPWLSLEINISLDAVQHGFSTPPQGSIL